MAHFFIAYTLNWLMKKKRFPLG